MKKILFIISMVFVLPLAACAEQVTIDNILYDVITKGKVAKVLTFDTQIITNLVIPSSVTYQGVECSVISIEKGTAHSSRRLTSVVIPGSVKTIARQAFYQCEYLTSVTISEV